MWYVAIRIHFLLLLIIIITTQVCLQLRERGRSRISFVGKQPGLDDAAVDLDEADPNDDDDDDALDDVSCVMFYRMNMEMEKAEKENRLIIS